MSYMCPIKESVSVVYISEADSADHLLKTSLWCKQLVFVEPFPRPPNTNAPTQLELNSLSVPLVHILQSEFKQPYFSANYLSILVHPVTGGGLPGRTTVEIRFLDQGLFGFVEMLDKLRNRAIAQRREVREANTLRE